MDLHDITSAESLVDCTARLRAARLHQSRMERVIELWRSGLDTWDIHKRVSLLEHEVCKILHKHWEATRGKA